MAEWIKKTSPDVVCAELEKHRRVADGKATFVGWWFRPFRITLEGMIRFQDEVPATQRTSIVNKACFNIGAKGRITPSSILKEITKLEHTYLRKKKRRYYLLVTASVPQTARIQLVKTGALGCQITFPKALRSPEKETILKAFEESPLVSKQDFPWSSLFVRIHTDARSVPEGWERALNAFDLLRSAWNLAINRNQSFRESYGQHKSVNQILLGPIQTIHLPDGTSTNSWWYEPFFYGTSNLKSADDKIKSCQNFWKSFSAHLNRSKYKNALTDCAIRYVRALDSRDWQLSFLQLWGLLEALTDTKNSPYDVTIRRASSIFRDKQLVRQTLNVLRHYRNRFVHQAEELPYAETALYQLKNFVEALLEFHLGSTFGFASLQEAGQFMDLPTSKVALRRGARMREYAIRRM